MNVAMKQGTWLLQRLAEQGICARVLAGWSYPSRAGVAGEQGHA